MDIRRLDLNLLLLFHELYLQQNLSAAAKSLAMSQPMASIGLRRLREFFVDQLFCSTGRGMRPTPFAMSIAQPVASVISKIKLEIITKVDFLPLESDRVFTISTSDIGTLVFAPPLLSRLGRDAPNTDLRCLSLPHRQLIDAMEQGTVDIAVGYFPDLVGDDIKSIKLFEHGFACIARRDHPVIGASISLEQFLAAEHMVVTQEGRSQEIFEHQLKALNLHRRVALEVSQFMSVPYLISSTNMIATVPLMLGLWYQDKKIKLLAPPIEVPKIEINLYWHKNTCSDDSVIWLRDRVCEELKGIDPSFSTRTTTVRVSC